MLPGKRLRHGPSVTIFPILSSNALFPRVCQENAGSLPRKTYRLLKQGNLNTFAEECGHLGPRAERISTKLRIHLILSIIQGLLQQACQKT